MNYIEYDLINGKLIGIIIFNVFRGKPFRRRAKYTDSLDDVSMDDDSEVPANDSSVENGTRHSRKFCDTSGGV